MAARQAGDNPATPGANDGFGPDRRKKLKNAGVLTKPIGVPPQFCPEYANPKAPGARGCPVGVAKAMLPWLPSAFGVVMLNAGMPPAHSAFGVEGTVNVTGFEPGEIKPAAMALPALVSNS